MLVAPSLTTSVSCVMVLAEDWAAWASLSWLDAAPDTSSLVSSTKALAVFNMFSLKCAETNTLQITQWDTQDYADIIKQTFEILCMWCWNCYVLLGLTCGLRKTLRSLRSVCRQRRTWWLCQDQQWCRRQNWLQLCRPEFLYYQPAGLITPWNTCRREWITLHYKLHRRSWDSVFQAFSRALIIKWIFHYLCQCI